MMEIKEVKKEGLVREYSVAMSPEALTAKFNEVVTQKAQTFKMPGFRDGKVPLTIIKRQIGEQLMKEVLDAELPAIVRAVREQSQGEMAMPPAISIESYGLEQGLRATVQFDVLPEMPEVDLSAISLEVYEVEPTQKDLENAYSSLLKSVTDFAPAEEGYKAQSGDVLEISFLGKIDGVPFQGGQADNFQIQIGSGKLVPGFEEQLIDLVVGDDKIVKVTFPEQYPELGGKDAEFEVQVRSVLRDRNQHTWDDAFAQKVGFKDIAELEGVVARKLSEEFSGMMRAQAKKDLFDVFDTKYQLEVPQTMLNADFQELWKNAQAEAKSKADKGQPENLGSEEEYKVVSERRVKIGLLLSNIAKINEISVSNSELEGIVNASIEQNSNKQKEILEYYQKNENVEALRNSIFEEKTVMFVMSKVNLIKHKVTPEEFMSKFFLKR